MHCWLGFLPLQGGPVNDNWQFVKICMFGQDFCPCKGDRLTTIGNSFRAGLEMSICTCLTCRIRFWHSQGLKTSKNTDFRCSIIRIFDFFSKMSLTRRHGGLFRKFQIQVEAPLEPEASGSIPGPPGGIPGPPGPFFPVESRAKLQKRKNNK